MAPLSVVAKAVLSSLSLLLTPAINLTMHSLPVEVNSTYLFLITVRQALIMFVNVILALLSCDLTPAISFTIVWVPVDVNSPYLFRIAVNTA